MYCVTMYQKFKAILILQIQLKKACHTQTKLSHYIKRFAKSEIIVIYTNLGAGKGTKLESHMER